MNCTECGTKCVLVETVTEPGANLKHYECPECCNCFARHTRKPRKLSAPRSWDFVG